jgi:hypothetical protein
LVGALAKLRKFQKKFGLSQTDYLPQTYSNPYFKRVLAVPGWLLLSHTTTKRTLIQQEFKVLTMTNSQPTQSTNKTKSTISQESQDKQQKFLQRIIAVSFVVQAALIGLKGNLDVLSGKPVLDVIQGMIAQGVSLIVKAAKESESKPRSKK